MEDHRVMLSALRGWNRVESGTKTIDLVTGIELAERQYPRSQDQVSGR